MNCPRHPNKRAVASCKDCKADFCIECVRETDQTSYCPECYRRRVSAMTREQTEVREEKEEARAALEEKPPQPLKPAAPVAKKAVAGETVAAEAAAPRRGLRDRIRRKAREEKPLEDVVAEAPEDFLSRGPDEDFSKLAEDRGKAGWRIRKGKSEVAEVAEEEEVPRAEKADVKPEAAPPSEESLLDDVMATLLKPEGDMTPERAATSAAAVADAGGLERAAARAEMKKAERAERWSFLSQPRVSEYTILAVSWWRATIFIVLMLLLGAVLWAVPNAYIIPKDSESALHAVVVGFIIGLAFWWKAGKKHSTKLAVQAALTTFFALFIGEFLHWFLIITKYDAFRTIFFDLVSFKFIWENGAQIMRYTVEAMFPVAFIWLMLLPTMTSFIVGFGMPPIPEIFSQFWRALRGKESEEASHGMEN